MAWLARLPQGNTRCCCCPQPESAELDRGQIAADCSLRRYQQAISTWLLGAGCALSPAEADEFRHATDQALVDQVLCTQRLPALADFGCLDLSLISPCFPLARQPIRSRIAHPARSYRSEREETSSSVSATTKLQSPRNRLLLVRGAQQKGHIPHAADRPCECSFASPQSERR